MVARPRRLYYDEKRNKYYYLVKGKKKFIKVPEGMSQKQIQKINLVNIIGDISKARKVKPRKKTRRLRLEKPIMEQMKQVQTITPFGSVVSFVRATEGLPSELKKEPNIENPVEPNKAKEANERLEKNIKEIKELQNSFKIYAEEKAKQFEKFETPQAEKKKKKNIDDKLLYGEVFLPFFQKNKIVPSWIEFVEGRTLNSKEMKKSIESAFPSDEYNSITQLKYNRALEQITSMMTSKKRKEPEEPEMVVEEPTARKEARIMTLSDINKRKREEEKDEEGAPPTKKVVGGGDDDGLYNNEIEDILQKRVRKVVPVIASDEVNDLIDLVDNGDREFMAVINTNPSTSDGSGNDGYRVGHWRCIYVDNRDDFPSVEFFDPLGDEPEKDVIKVLHRIAQKINPENLFKYKVNRVKMQDNDTANCGHFVMKFLEDRHRGVPFSEATMFDDVMKSCGDKSDIGEMEIKKFKKYL